MIRLLTLIIGLFSFPLLAKPSPAIKKALDASWQIQVVGVSFGSGVAIEEVDGGSLIITNDHVCQSSRGANPLSGNVRYNSKLGSVPIYVQGLMGRFPATIVKTGNLHLVRAPKKESDLCLLFVKQKLPTIDFIDGDLEVGDEIFGVGSPSGFFPSIYKGYAGRVIQPRSPTENPILFNSVYANHGSSGGGVFSMDGKLGAITFAIVQDDENNSPVVSISVPAFFVKKFLKDYFDSLKSKETSNEAQPW